MGLFFGDFLGEGVLEKCELLLVVGVVGGGDFGEWVGGVGGCCLVEDDGIEGVDGCI